VSTPRSAPIGLGAALGLVVGAVAVGAAQLVAGILDPETSPIVAVGQRAIGGETVFADLKSNEMDREARAL